MRRGFIFRIIYPRVEYDLILYRGKDAMSVFILTVRELANYKTNSHETPEHRRNSKFCEQRVMPYICGEVLGDDRVKDHDHITGKYRGAAHGCCNIEFQIPSFLPVIIHNLSNYDSRLIVPHLGYEE
ncbi:hypothetical protein J437_LFUL012442 [Ladona fulva]|uniref:Uncharacterized protein n=1 Tax=Ladona fulva TaxID=123851 RepID=A0A8K0P5Y2_LADFU|nr:hypothetical protein J437_LFUL012442 [Ladona fulva]